MKPLASDPTESESYVVQSRRPLTALVFVAPMLLLYEVGALMMGPQSLRNGADVWLREFLQLLGFSQYLLLPLVTGGILLAWHHTTRQPWRVRPGVLGLMFLESLGWAFLLLLIAQGLGRMFATQGAMAPSNAINLDGLILKVVGPFGAGIYEELLFRLMLFPIALGALKLAKQPDKVAYPMAILVVSLLFSAAHYKLFTSVGDDFELYSFTFRALAGVFFCLLFVGRGFGVAVGAHAFYDVFVTVLSLFR